MMALPDWDLICVRCIPFGADLLAFKEFDGGHGGDLLNNIALGLHKVTQVLVGFK
jgi:hypothetical protein